MGMDVYGIAPTAPEGVYFRRNFCGWRPIANFIIETQPKIAALLRPGSMYDDVPGEPTVDSWHYNAGNWLDAESSLKLADALDEMLTGSEAEAYVKFRDATLKRLPYEMCDRCQGTGMRSHVCSRRLNPVDLEILEEEGFAPRFPGFGETDCCNKCSGAGSIPNSETHYYLSVEDVREFSAFARASGGFLIE
jgi:hypothetical protein